MIVLKVGFLFHKFLLRGLFCLFHHCANREKSIVFNKQYWFEHLCIEKKRMSEAVLKILDATFCMSCSEL